MAKDLKVFYKEQGRTLRGNITLTVSYDSIAYTIAEWESRNPNTMVTDYLGDDNTWVEVPPRAGFQQFPKMPIGVVIAAPGIGKSCLAEHLAMKIAEERASGKQIIVVGDGEEMLNLSKEAMEQIRTMRDTSPIHLELKPAELYAGPMSSSKSYEKKNWKSKTRRGR